VASPARGLPCFQSRASIGNETRGSACRASQRRDETNKLLILAHDHICPPGRALPMFGANGPNPWSRQPIIELRISTHAPPAFRISSGAVANRMPVASALARRGAGVDAIQRPSTGTEEETFTDLHWRSTSAHCAEASEPLAAAALALHRATCCLQFNVTVQLNHATSAQRTSR
jgi:hypothetical protein